MRREGSGEGVAINSALWIAVAKPADDRIRIAGGRNE